MGRIKILLADDRPEWIKNWQEDLNHLDISDLNIHTQVEADEVYAALESDTFDILLLDMDWTDGGGRKEEGIEMLRRAKQASPATDVIIITGYGAGENYERIRNAYKYGVTDFLQKGDKEYHKSEFERIIRNALEKARLKRKAVSPFWRWIIDESGISIENTLGNLLGRSEMMRGLFSVIKKVAQTDSRLLLLGETGVGKSEIARTIHKLSNRKFREMVEFTPGEFPETLQESELFGHEKGAFTGAAAEKAGLIKQAHESTLFIDEVGTMMSSMQAKLLRFLDTKEFRKLGGKADESSDIRLICATNRNIHKDALEEKFRPDLLMRISGFPLHIPPLRDHLEDIPLLAEKFLKKHSAAGRENRTFELTEDGLNKLLRYDWPGNIRELDNVFERAVPLAVISGSDRITAAHVRFDREIYIDNDAGITALVNLDRLYSLIKNRENRYDDAPSLAKAWGELIARQIIDRAMKEARGHMKQSGILLNFYEGLDKEESPADHKKYEAYRQYLTTQLKIKARDYK
ncbi:MAG: sigma-54 dependent transcriptional regulator [Thermodesulfobacteriota bacterium]